MRYIYTTISILVLILMSGMTATGQPPNSQLTDHAIGQWHGALDTGAGKLTLIINISHSEDGALSAYLESPDQAPGQKIPVSSVTVTQTYLALSLQVLGAAYEGTWDENRQAWVGTWRQGATELPLDFVKGTPAQKKAAIEGMDGYWEGNIERSGQKVPLNLTIESHQYGTSVQFGSPNFSLQGLPVNDFSRQGDGVQFSVPATGAQFTGALAPSGEGMSGIWRFPNRPDVTITFVRTREIAEATPRARPQHPQPPFEYLAEEVTFSNPTSSEVSLAGTLTIPKGAGPFPAVILITGSGPQDRDETLAGHKPFAVIADHLSRNGVAVLRYDDRGVAQSTGVFPGATSADFATDANAAALYLATRADIDEDAIGFIGHSEGGVVGPLAANENDQIRFLILLAAPGVDFVEIAIAQRRMFAILSGADMATAAKSEPYLRTIYSSIIAAASKDEAEQIVQALLKPEMMEALDIEEGQEEFFIREMTSDWLRFLLSYHPSRILDKVDVPVLAMGGSLDTLVPSDVNLPAIKQALNHNPDVTIIEFDGLNHMFQSAETGLIGEYAELEETFAPIALETLSSWINERF